MLWKMQFDRLMVGVPRCMGHNNNNKTNCARECVQYTLHTQLNWLHNSILKVCGVLRSGYIKPFFSQFKILVVGVSRVGTGCHSSESMAMEGDAAEGEGGESGGLLLPGIRPKSQIETARETISNICSVSADILSRFHAHRNAVSLAKSATMLSDGAPPIAFFKYC